VRTARDVPVIVCCGEPAASDERADALRRAGVIVESAPQESGRLKLGSVLRSLGASHGVSTVFCEAGARLTGSLIREGLADELLVFTGPLALGDPSARSALEIGETTRLSEARRMSLTLTRRLGEDVMSVYSLADPSPSDRSVRSGGLK
jgi:diaminohydroxyphosphoribosylaminopyrimidine deaminase/5-amino-6-(5-phosphoribosylamino)uracil reductase